MSEIPKAPVLTRELFKDLAVGKDVFMALKNIQEWIAVEWAKVFEGAEVVYGEAKAGVWDEEQNEDDTLSAILLKPVPIKEPGVTRAEIAKFIDDHVWASGSPVSKLFQRILDEGLADG